MLCTPNNAADGLLGSANQNEYQVTNDKFEVLLDQGDENQVINVDASEDEMHVNNGTAQFESQEPEERIETDTVSVRDTLLKSKVTMKDSSYRKESKERLEVEAVESNVVEE